MIFSLAVSEVIQSPEIASKYLSHCQNKDAHYLNLQKKFEWRYIIKVILLTTEQDLGMSIHGHFLPKNYFLGQCFSNFGNVTPYK